jgi:hypothetical protein
LLRPLSAAQFGIVVKRAQLDCRKYYEFFSEKVPTG